MMPSHTNNPRAPQQPRALLDFLRAESAGGVVLILSAIVALVLANSATASSYNTVLHWHIGSHELQFWIDDGLMAIFFLLVGLELRREMTEGELASVSRLAAPVIAALGGMIVPAIIFSAFNYEDREAMRGWAVPVATDVAFALAVLSVLGRRVPTSLTVFLTALAIIDDFGAIIVIALFYSYKLHLEELTGVFLLLAVLWALDRAGVRILSIYLIGGALLWLLMLRSGIHATLSGVALAFVIPSRPHRPGGVSPVLRLERVLTPIVAYVVLPLFGLANAGLRFDTLPSGAAKQPLVLGTALALIVGKQAGVFGAVMLAARLKLAQLPAAVSTLQLYGAAVLCGIGFTMSLFIGDLAFRGTARQDEIKLAVFAASAISAVLGLAVLAAGSRRQASAER